MSSMKRSIQRSIERRIGKGGKAAKTVLQAVFGGKVKQRKKGK
jgi:hypothetical protein